MIQTASENPMRREDGMGGSIPVIPLPPGLSWSFVISPLGPVGLAATPRGVCRVELGAGPRWAREVFPGKPLSHVFPHAFPGGKLIVAWLNGAHADLSGVPLDIDGTPFQMAVWCAAAQIPRGQTRTYAQVAEAVGSPGAARAVGQALGANPVPLLVPCHRVVAAGGGLGGFTGGLDLKRRLLALEQSEAVQ
ncbi:MAG: methylated-DNA--[protein]-cysteine S-methyltransferase [Nitrospirota bacterium]|nr:methylated-DNA--[protein]-cysteine S-methyltransferase [Nitrospirota bacterium]